MNETTVPLTKVPCTTYGSLTLAVISIAFVAVRYRMLSSVAQFADYDTTPAIIAIANRHRV